MYTIQTHKCWKERCLVTRHEDNTAQPETDKCLIGSSSHLLSFLPFKSRHCSAKYFVFVLYQYLSTCFGLVVSSLLRNVDKRWQFVIVTTRCHGSNPRWPPHKRNYWQFVSKVLFAKQILFWNRYRCILCFFCQKDFRLIAFCSFNKFIFNICINSAFFFSLSSYSIIKQKHTVLLPNPSVKIKITVHTSTTQFHCSNFVHSWANVVVVKAQTLPIFIKITKATTNQ